MGGAGSSQLSVRHRAAGVLAIRDVRPSTHESDHHWPASDLAIQILPRRCLELDLTWSNGIFPPASPRMP